MTVEAPRGMAEHAMRPTQTVVFDRQPVQPLEQKIDAVHEAILPHVIESGFYDYVRTGDRSVLEPAVQTEVDILHSGVKLLRDTVSSPRAKTDLQLRKLRHDLADVQTEGQSTTEQIAKRLTQFKGPLVVITDADNTLSDHTGLNKKNGIDPHLLGSAIADPYLGKERENFPEAFVSVWQPLLREHAEIFAEGGKKTPLREGVNELGQFLADHTTTYVNSTNFEPYIKALLARITGGDTFIPHAVTEDDFTAIDKGNVIKLLALLHPESAIIYQGDGSSDLPTLEASDAVAGYLALEGSTFAQQLEERNIPHMTYRTSHDSKAALEQVMPQAA